MDVNQHFNNEQSREQNYNACQKEMCIHCFHTTQKENQHNVFGGMIKKTAGTSLNDVFNTTTDKPGTGRHLTIGMKTM